MSALDAALLVTGCAGILMGVGAWTFALVAKPSAARPTRGIRGLKRARALCERDVFAVTEPLIRYVAARVSHRPLRALRPKLKQLIVQAGDHLGLSEDELLASSALMGGCAVAASAGFVLVFDLSATWVPVAGAIGTCLPYLRIRAVAQGRTRRVTRGLPAVIELAAMCMGAGLDFPGSLKRVVDSAPDPDEPIIEELVRILRELDLGCTRRAALQGFANRVPTDEARELVNSATQAEDKGSPLARILTIQAQTLRLRRSVAAEEAASSAALMLVGPTALIFICVIALLLGPVVVRFMTAGVTAW